MTQWGRVSAVAAELDRYAPILLSDAGAAPPASFSVVNGSTRSADDTAAAVGSGVSWLSARARWADPPGAEGVDHEGDQNEEGGGGSGGGSKDVLAGGEQGGGSDYYLFVANDGSGAGKVTIFLGAGVVAVGPVEVVSETPTRQIPVEGQQKDRFQDTINAKDVVVYRIPVKQPYMHPPFY